MRFENSKVRFYESCELRSQKTVLTEIGALVFNFLLRSNILNRLTVSTHYKIQKYIKKICLHKSIVEIMQLVYIIVKLRNCLIKVKKEVDFW